MKFNLLLLTICLLFSRPLFAQSSSDSQAALKDNVRAEVETNVRAIFSGDFQTAVKHIPPVLIEMMGGKDSAIVALQKFMASAKEKGLELDSISVTAPTDIVKAGSELQCVVPAYVRMKFPGVKVHVASTMVGYSTNQGKTWYFFDNSKLDPASLRKLHPAFSSTLAIPESPKAVLEKGE